MGDCQNGDLRVNFDRTLKLKFLGSQLTTDAGLLAYRELDEALHLTETGAESVQDSRLGQNKQHGLLPLLRQSIYSRLAGYEDVNDAERLCVDPTMRHVVGGKASQPEKQAASTSEVGRFETEMLSTKNNLTALMNLSGRWIDTVHERKPLKELIMPIRLRSSIGQNTKRFLARARANARPSGGKRRPNQICGGASSIRTACETNFSAGKSAGLLGFHITLG